MEKQEQITIKDIARRLNMHHTTVSRALRGSPNVKLATRELVQSVAEELDYHPNISAQNLKTRQSKVIGMIVPSVHNDFFAEVISGVEEEAFANGYSISLAQSHDNYDREAVSIRAMASHSVAGMIVSVSKDTKLGSRFKIFQKRGIPLVFFDRICRHISAGSVSADDKNGAFKVVTHLADSGYRRIAHLAGPSTISVSQNRLQGYREALEAKSMQFDDELVIYGDFDQPAGVTGANQLLSLAKPPDAIFAINDQVAMGAYQVVQERGLNIPQDIGIAGFGNTILSGYVDPPLTTVKQSASDMGHLAAKMVIDRIEGRIDPDAVDEQVLGTDLIVRKSSMRTG